MSVKVSIIDRLNLNIVYILLNQLSDTHNKMENTTSRLAVHITKYPPFEFQWSDTSSQKSRSELDEKDILPSEAHGACLHTHMIEFMMSFIVKEFVSLSDLAQFIPSDSVPPVQKNRSSPFKITL